MKKADAFFMGTRGGGSKHPASATNTIYIHLSAPPVCKPNHTPTNMTATSHTHGEERRYHYGNHRQDTRRSAPSPAGRSPQRGRVGEGVSDIAQEPKWRFFTFAAPTPALPHGGRGHIGGFLFFSSLHKLRQTGLFQIYSTIHTPERSTCM